MNLNLNLITQVWQQHLKRQITLQCIKAQFSTLEKLLQYSHLPVGVSKGTDETNETLA